MIKCSICSYQCDNWYTSNWRFACHINFSLGRLLWACSGFLSVSSPSHTWWCSTPLRDPSRVLNALLSCAAHQKSGVKQKTLILRRGRKRSLGILVEGAIALPVTPGGGVLFASWKLFQFLSRLIVKVILAIFKWALAWQTIKHSISCSFFFAI